MPATPLTFRQLTSKHLERAKRKLAIALNVRDLFQQFLPHAIRHLTDDDRRVIARLGNELGWKRVAKIVTIASVRTIRRWFRRLLGMPDGGKAPCGRARTSAEIASLVVQCAQENSWSSDA